MSTFMMKLSRLLKTSSRTTSLEISSLYVELINNRIISHWETITLVILLSQANLYGLGCALVGKPNLWFKDSEIDIFAVLVWINYKTHIFLAMLHMEWNKDCLDCDHSLGRVKKIWWIINSKLASLSTRSSKREINGVILMKCSLRLSSPNKKPSNLDFGKSANQCSSCSLLKHLKLVEELLGLVKGVEVFAKMVKPKMKEWGQGCKWLKSSSSYIFIVLTSFIVWLAQARLMSSSSFWKLEFGLIYLWLIENAFNDFEL